MQIIQHKQVVARGGGHFVDQLVDGRLDTGRQRRHPVHPGIRSCSRRMRHLRYGAAREIAQKAQGSLSALSSESHELGNGAMGKPAGQQCALAKAGRRQLTSVARAGAAPNRGERTAQGEAQSRAANGARKIWWTAAVTQQPPAPDAGQHWAIQKGP